MAGNSNDNDEMKEAAEDAKDALDEMKDLIEDAIKAAAKMKSKPDAKAGKALADDIKEIMTKAKKLQALADDLKG